MVPVVLITSLESKADRILGLQAGCDEFLSKPVHRDELRARVASLLKLQAARKALDHERSLIEESKRTAIQQAFERYVSPGVVGQILQTGNNAFLQNNENRRDVVALFADMRGFTRMSETLLPSQVVAILNAFFSALTQVAHRHNGTVLSMAGDCLLIGFGVPLALADVELSSLLAGADIVRAIRPLQQQWKIDYGADVGVGIGINRGEVIVGNIGSQSYMSYTIIGDAVNVAARLTDLAAPGEILLTERLRAKAQASALSVGLIDEKQLDTQLKGKSAAVRAFRYRVV
jgi:class 3 adenylate cyclase